MSDKEDLIEKAKDIYEKSEGAKERLKNMASEDEFGTAVDKLTSVKGIGKATAKQIAEQMSDKDLGIQDLVGLEDMTEIKGIGASVAEDIRADLKKEPKQVEETSKQESKESGEEEAGELEGQEDVKTAPTTQKLRDIKKERSGAAQKYIGKSRH